MGFPQETLIRNGTMVTADGTFDADLRIRRERIVAIKPSLPIRSGDSVIDALGLLVLPGGIDPHVHLTCCPSTPFEARRPDDLLSGSWAALAGGVTTVDEIASPDGDEGVVDTIDRVEADVRSMSLVDVFVHPTLGSATRKIDQISKLPQRGQPSLKVLLMDPSLANDTSGLKRALRRAADAGVIVLFHCESLLELSVARDVLIQQGKTSLYYLPESRPVIAEARATEQAIALCRETGATGYIVHISSAEALALCSEARTAGLPIRIETRPAFLHLTVDRHRGKDRKLHVIIPPLREDADREALWRGLIDGSIDTVATDHASLTRKQKFAAQDTFDDLRMGISGLQLFRPILFSEGVAKRRISVERFVEITATAAARIFGLYPQKGTIAVGSDADLVLWDPQETRTINAADLFSQSGVRSTRGGRPPAGQG